MTSWLPPSCVTRNPFSQHGGSASLSGSAVWPDTTLNDRPWEVDAKWTGLQTFNIRLIVSTRICSPSLKTTPGRCVSPVGSPAPSPHPVPVDYSRDEWMKISGYLLERTNGWCVIACVLACVRVCVHEGSKGGSDPIRLRTHLFGNTRSTSKVWGIVTGGPRCQPRAAIVSWWSWPLRSKDQ